MPTRPVEAHRALAGAGVQRAVGGHRQRGGIGHVGVQHHRLAGDAVRGSVDEHGRGLHAVAALQHVAVFVDEHDVLGAISLQCNPRGLIRKRRLSSGSGTLKWLHTPSLRPWCAAARNASAKSSHSGCSILGSAAVCDIGCLRGGVSCSLKHRTAAPRRLPTIRAMSHPPLPDTCDVLVIGAGPAGSACAQALAAGGSTCG
jgi:hypothetical protein